MLAVKEQGNEAFRRGDWTAASNLYAQALALIESDENGHETDLRSVLLSNSSAAKYKMSLFQEALQDADLAIAANGSSWKAHARRARALVPLKRFVEASVSFCLASQLSSDAATHRTDLVEAILNSVSGIRKRGVLVTKPGQKYGPGDVCVQAGKGAYRMLLKTVESDDVWVKYASLLQLSQLAQCPRHRELFLNKRGIQVFCFHAQVSNLDKIFPPRRSLEQVSPLLSAKLKQLIGFEYEAMHPKCVLARGFAHLTEYQSCCPHLNSGRIFLHDREVMSSMNTLVGETAMCPNSQQYLGSVAKVLVEEVGRGGNREIMLAIDQGLIESVTKLIRAANENEHIYCAKSFQNLLNKLLLHPDHPQNQIPTE